MSRKITIQLCERSKNIVPDEQERIDLGFSIREIRSRHRQAAQHCCCRDVWKPPLIQIVTEYDDACRHLVKRIRHCLLQLVYLHYSRESWSDLYAVAGRRHRQLEEVYASRRDGLR